MFDADGTLLYVGCTGHLPRRLEQHRGDKPWWVDVATVTVEHYATAELGLAAEAAAIADESPRYNVDPTNAAQRGWETRRARSARWHAKGKNCLDMGCPACRPDIVRARSLAAS